MNVRKTLSVVLFVAVAAPFASFASDGGDFDKTHPPMPADAKVDRGENRTNGEFTIDELVKSAASDKTREEVKRELAASPMEHYGA